MSSPAIADVVRLRLSQSLPLIDTHRNAIKEKMQERLQEFETPDEAFGQAEITGDLLVDLLIMGVGDLASAGRLRDLGAIAREHRRLDIDGRHYSRFGLVVTPVLVEALGLRLPPKTASAWCDAFWHIVGQMAPQEEVQSRYG